MYTRMNWGEPWYADFRESQTEYRLKNQAYFKRNLMPAMLGWFSMRDNTSIEDIEWMLARSAAFNAGYGFVCNYEVLEKNANTPAILNLIKEWEKARMADAFTIEQRIRMEDIANEFSLKPISPESWELRQVYSYKFQHTPKERQPGEPTSSTFTWELPVSGEGTSLVFSAVDTDVQNIQLEWNNYKTLEAPFRLKAGQYLCFTEDQTWILYDQNWKPVRQKKTEDSIGPDKAGSYSASLNAEFRRSGKEPRLKMEVRVKGQPELVAPQVDL
jgi:hypothetical protein